MTAFFAQHGGTILVSLLVAAGVVLAIRKLVRDKRNGKSICGDNCSSCPHSGTCHKDTTL